MKQQVLEEICARVDRKVQEGKALRFGDIAFDLHIGPADIAPCKAFLSQYVELARAYHHERRELRDKERGGEATRYHWRGVCRCAQSRARALY